MNRHDYSDTEDFYTQNFRSEGHVSIWLGQLPLSKNDEEIDILQGNCGVGYYNLDDQESNSYDFQNVEIEMLLKEISYSEHFLVNAIVAAKDKGITHCRWIIVQFDFIYQENMVKRAISADPVFIGSFPYSKA
jgi:hypothetical protein